MRRYGRILVWLAFLGVFLRVSIPVISAEIQQWLLWKKIADPNTLFDKAVNSLVYPIKPGQWLVFSVPEESRQLRIITNAHIKRGDSLRVNPNWAYAIRYEMLDTDNNVVSTGLYHQYSQVTGYRDDKGKLVYNNFYANKAVVPLDGRVMLFSLQGMKRIAVLKLKLEPVHPDINEAAVRVYVPVRIAEQQLATEWLRMKQSQRENLAKNSIYPASLLSPEEKKNLVKNQWQPLGPMGIAKKNYQMQILYTINDIGSAPTYTLATGLQADAAHDAVIPLPEGGGEVELSFKSLDGASLVQPLVVDLEWFGRTRQEHWRKKTDWSPGMETLKYSLSGGLLVIRPSLPVIVSVMLSTVKEPKHDISDVLLSIKSYRAAIGVDFDVLHYRDQPAAVRIDARKILEPSVTSGAGKLRYQALNEAGLTIVEGALAAPVQASRYDRIASITDVLNVTDPVSYYLNLPADVVRLRFGAEDPAMLVSVYNQPFGFTKKQMIPEDLYQARSAFKEPSDKQLSWFPLPAANDQELYEQKGVQWISGQYRPPEEKPDVMASDYLWQDFMPQPIVPAYYILTDYADANPRPEALPNVYCEITPNRAVPVSISAAHRLQTVAPELVYLRDSVEPFKFDLDLDGRPALMAEAIGKQGVYRLPEIPVAKHRLRLKSSGGGQWLMNYQSVCAGKRALKKRVFKLEADTPVEFTVKHGLEDDVFTARFFTLAGNDGRSQIKIDISPETAAERTGNALAENWTYTRRVYDIRPPENGLTPVMYDQKQSMNAGEQFVIPVNRDLPEGNYRIRAALAGGSPGMIILSQIKPGSHEQRRFYREDNLEIR